MRLVWDRERPERQRAAQGAVDGFQDGHSPFVVAAETTRTPIVFTAAKIPGHPIVFTNQAFLTLTGYEEHEVLGQSFDFLMEGSTDPEMLTEIETAYQGGRRLEPTVCYRHKDGTSLWVTLLIVPVRDEGGDVVQHFASFVDVTQKKEEEDRVRLLVAGLTRRTYDTLTSVLDIARQTFGEVADQGLVAAFEERVLALSESYVVLDHITAQK